jgi:hypothetical protein
MKFTVRATMAAMLATCAWAAGWEKVVVCVDEGDQGEVVNNATRIVDRIFLPAGLMLEWHGEGRLCPDHSERIIRISLSTHSNPDLHPGAWAYALPYEGEHIVVFYDRLQRAYSGSVATLLAYVIAHEMTHILQGISRHSEKGVMKAQWDQEDYAGMKLHLLTFTETDLQLIRHGVAGYKDLRDRTQIAKSAVAEGKSRTREFPATEMGH